MHVDFVVRQQQHRARLIRRLCHFKRRYMRVYVLPTVAVATANRRRIVCVSCGGGLCWFFVCANVCVSEWRVFAKAVRKCVNNTHADDDYETHGSERCVFEPPRRRFVLHGAYAVPCQPNTLPSAVEYMCNPVLSRLNQNKQTAYIPIPTNHHKCAAARVAYSACRTHHAIIRERSPI